MATLRSLMPQGMDVKTRMRHASIKQMIKGTPAEVSPAIGVLGTSPAVERNKLMRGAMLMKKHPKMQGLS